jgi:hypothetical protein
LNLRPSAPKADALPSCATSRADPEPSRPAPGESRGPPRPSEEPTVTGTAGKWSEHPGSWHYGRRNGCDPAYARRQQGRRRLPRGCSSMVEPQPSKLATRVRSPSPAREEPQVRRVFRPSKCLDVEGSCQIRATSDRQHRSAPPSKTALEHRNATRGTCATVADVYPNCPVTGRSLAAATIGAPRTAASLCHCFIPPRVQQVPGRAFRLLHGARSDNGGEVSRPRHLRPLGRAHQIIPVKTRPRTACQCSTLCDAGSGAPPAASRPRPRSCRPNSVPRHRRAHRRPRNRLGAPWSRRKARR